MRHVGGDWLTNDLLCNVDWLQLHKQQNPRIRVQVVVTWE
jgi:hypothetical protein